MKLYNSLTNQVEPFEVGEDNTVRMYVCGVTPYDTSHVGHAFTYVNFDVLERYLEFKGHKTITVQNVTDIDDDILRKAKEVGLTWDELGKHETEKYQKAMRALNVREPDHFPKASEETEKIIEIVSGLIEQGYGYVVDGNVYYSVKDDPAFGKLNNMPYGEMLKIANERGNFPDDKNKRDPLDFVLWQAAQPGEPTWDSPWGPGRPGWHIECTAMGMRYLGETIDIHAGGADLEFPHHEAEISQAERFTGKSPFVRFWMHYGMVRLDGEKMSKSLGNMQFVMDFLEDFSPDAIRIFLLNHKYRDVWNSDNAMIELQVAEAMLTKWRMALNYPEVEPESAVLFEAEPFKAQFIEAMDNDLDTPKAINVLDKLAMAMSEAAREGASIEAAKDQLKTLADVLGLTLEPVPQKEAAAS